jgi:hypothetical protein
MESVETLNKRLRDFYGLFETNEPKWRLGHSSQTELQVGRFNVFTEAGLYLRTEEGVREVPKYPFIKPPKWILERLVPVNTDAELKLTKKTSYEPLWVFGKKGNPQGEAIEPSWEAIEFIISLLQKGPGVPQKIRPETMEEKEKRISLLEQELFGDTSEVADALYYKEGITVPTNYSKE